MQAYFTYKDFTLYLLPFEIHSHEYFPVIFRHYCKLCGRTLRSNKNEIFVKFSRAELLTKGFLSSCTSLFKLKKIFSVLLNSN